MYDEKVTDSLNKKSVCENILPLQQKTCYHWFSEPISPGRQLKSHLLHTMQGGLLEQNENTISLIDEGKYQQNRQT